MANTVWSPHFFGLCLFALFATIHLVVGPPAVIKDKGEHNNSLQTDHASTDDSFDLQHDLEYSRYLKEVVEALESDPEFRKKLETAEEHDFRNGKVASELEYVNHHVRTKLDELKRTEIQRLRDLVDKKNDVERRKTNGDHHVHLDHGNLETFEIKDLQMLMDKVRKDLDQADKMRRENFKEYELEKEFEKNQKLKEMDDEHQKAYLKQVEEEKKKSQHHDPLHHPGSRAQLEEVWEKGDHMESQQFQPLAFFHLHDVDGNGYWDEQEVNALFLKELDKIYKDHPNADLREREEEMERMREHVFNEVDTNRDRLISFKEFFDQTRKEEFQRDEGWETLDQRPQFSQQEYEAFERQRQFQMQGHLPPHAPGVAYPHPQQVPVYHQYPGQVPHQPGHQGPQYVAPQYNQYQTVNQIPGGQPQAVYHGQPPVGGQPSASMHHLPPQPVQQQYQYQQHPQMNHMPQSGQPIQPGQQGNQQVNQQPPANQGQYQQPPPANQGQYQQPPPANQGQFQQSPSASQGQLQQQPVAANQGQANQQPPESQQFNQPAQPVQGQYQQQQQPQQQQVQPQPPVNQQPQANQYQQPPQVNQFQQPASYNSGHQPVVGNQAAQFNNIPQSAVNNKHDSKEPKRR